MDKRFSLRSFVIGAILGIILASAWFLNKSFYPLQTTTIFPPLSSATTSEPIVAASGAVSVYNQPAGDTVAIGSVTVPPPGVWVAVRETKDGNLGNVLGAARVAGPRTNVSVPLLRATEPGNIYAVELYRDSGDNVFNLVSESVYIDFNTDQPVIAYFTTIP